jgi:predicted RNase H-like nuclease (RuvC/YqgF family)|tara:strand:- start:998 stop:1393 length:396 start_codon:yes stop_codon:yes gene_type:complete
MNQMLLAFCLVLGGTSYWLYTENETLKVNNAKLEGAVATQEEAIATMQADFSLQTEMLQAQTLRSQEIQRELNRYSDFIKNYKLTAKILEDPVEMERKINNGTKHAFENIEKLSATVDDLDDGLQLQPTIN